MNGLRQVLLARNAPSGILRLFHKESHDSFSCLAKIVKIVMCLKQYHVVPFIKFPYISLSL